jgi:hypothetical protein
MGRAEQRGEFADIDAGEPHEEFFSALHDLDIADHKLISLPSTTHPQQTLASCGNN